LDHWYWENPEFFKERGMADIKWAELKGERSRTYHFPGGDAVTFMGVSRLEVRESGSHRLETADGKKAFVHPGWLWLDIDAESWSL
jgi:hypothetical protein